MTTEHQNITSNDQAPTYTTLVGTAETSEQKENRIQMFQKLFLPSIIYA